MPAITRTASVAEIVGEHAAAATAFRRSGPDEFRRNDAALVPGARRELQLDDGEVFAQVEDAIEAAAGELQDAGASAVCDDDLLVHIADHHAYARRVLPYAMALLAKIAGRHGKRNAKLSALYDVGEELANRLDDQMEEEERDVFSALLTPGTRREILRLALERMFGSRGEIRMLLMRMRWLADGFVAPEWAGRSYRALMEELAALEEDVLEHMHLERYVLLPRLSRRYLDAR